MNPRASFPAARAGMHLQVLRGFVAWAAIVAAMALGSTPAIPAQAQAQAEIQAVISGLEDELLTAFNKLDPEALDRLLDDEFVVVFPNGVQNNKQQRMAALKEPPGSIPQYTNLSVQIRALPGVAVAIVVARVSSGEAGRTSSVRLLSTRVWVDRGGRWRILSAQVAQLRDP